MPSARAGEVPRGRARAPAGRVASTTLPTPWYRPRTASALLRAPGAYACL